MGRFALDRIVLLAGFLVEGLDAEGGVGLLDVTLDDRLIGLDESLQGAVRALQVILAVGYAPGIVAAERCLSEGEPGAQQPDAADRDREKSFHVFSFVRAAVAAGSAATGRRLPPAFLRRQ